jgi:hypothetical protein
MTDKKRGRFNQRPRPKKTIKPLQVKTVGSHEKLHVVILSAALHEYWTHWDGRRTIPCIEPLSRCRGHICQMPQRWYGYIHCLENGGKKSYIVSLTKDCADSLEEQLAGNELRGTIVVIERARRTVKAPLVVDVVGRFVGKEPLPKEVDPKPTLMRMWGIIDEDVL